MAHVRIMAAAQPFISGAISKTINMPFDATVQDVADVYMAAADSMVKALALYRDGSKLSQPLSSSAFDDIYDDEDEDLDVALAAPAVEHPAVRAAEEFVRGLQRGARESLPSRRRGYAQKASVGGHSIYLHTGEFTEPGADGRPRVGEIFVSMSKEGASFGALMNCFAIAVSIGLQHGVPLSAYVDSFIFQKFEPNGLVVGHDRIHMATSIIDYIFRELAVSYLGREDLAHFGPVEDDHDLPDESDVAEAFPPATAPLAAYAYEAGDTAGAAPTAASAAAVADAPVAASTPVAASAPPALPGGIAASSVLEFRAEQKVRVTQARQRGFEGDPCDECGQLMMVRNGTCLKCMNCGATSGCS
jgi:ribonucleoside-diphosphate reductase alpha chain